MRGSLRIGRISGIEIGIHYTWLLAFFLITWLLARSYFPDTYAGWSILSYWGAGLLSALLLFISVLIHELAHSLVAQARGLPVSSITLFILGGVSNLTEEPQKPAIEFVMAIVGPLTSLVLAGVFWGLEHLLGSPGTFLKAIIGYLALVNLGLAAFNILPGFPLDGGRVLRSILWSTTGDLVKATNIAAIIGRIFGWAFIALGIWLAFFVQGGFLNGIWLAIIGFFLNSAADNSRNEVTLREHLSGVPVGQVMENNTESVNPRMLVSDLVQTVFLQRRRRAIPVTEGEQVIGMVTIGDVSKLPQEKWPFTPVERVMTREPLRTVKPEDDLNAAMKFIAQYDLNQVPVVSEGKLVGLLTRADVINYLHLSQELRLKNRQKTKPATP
jgi:Zn-dependent protease/CBS domain-containing protein